MNNRKYISKNELDKFAYHDAHINELYFENGNMILMLDDVNAMKSNSQNDNPTDTCIKNARFLFENVNIEGIVFSGYSVESQDGSKKEIPERAADISEYGLILEEASKKSAVIFGLERFEEKNGKCEACFAIHACNDLYYFTFSFDNVIAEWDGFAGKAWYEKIERQISEKS